MNWLNLNVQTLDSEQFLGSDPVDRATWLCLLRYSIGQENSGVVSDCKEWTDRKWQQLVRITKKEASRKCDLWSWEGDVLTVWGYPEEKEAEIKRLRDIGKQTSEAKRAAAKANGAKGGRPKNNPPENPTQTQQETQQETHGKPIERKGSRKEVEVEVISQSAGGHETPNLDSVKAYAQSAPVPISEACAIAFHDTQEAHGWITKHGHSIADWRAALRRYASLWNENEKSKSPPKTEHRQAKASTEYPEPKSKLPRL